MKLQTAELITAFATLRQISGKLLEFQIMELIGAPGAQPVQNIAAFAQTLRLVPKLNVFQMFNLFILKITKKFILFFLILIFSFFGLYFWYNQGKEVSAQESKPITCKKQPELNLPWTTLQFGPNELELPIGKATDETQAMAEKIIRELSKMITAAQAEIEAASTTIEYAGECGLNNCTTPGCYEPPRPPGCDECLNPLNAAPPDCLDWSPPCPGNCERPSCGGNACLHKKEMEDKAKEVEDKVKIIKDAYNKINDLFALRPNPPIGCWLRYCPPSPLPQNPACRTDIEIVLDKLEKSRSGDYLGCEGWIRQPSGLKDCVLRPEDQEAFLRGEKAGKLLLTCKEALSSGLLSDKETDCYGMTACIGERDKTGTILENCPRAENYYCCE